MPAQALALPARKAKPAIADHRVVALRLGHDEVVRRRRLGGCHNIGFGSADAPERDVGTDAVVKQRHLLADDGQGIAQACQRHVPHVLAIDPYPAGGDVKQARHQVDDGGCRRRTCPPELPRALPRARLARTP